MTFGQARRILRNRDSKSRRKLGWCIKPDICDGRHWTETLGAGTKGDRRKTAEAAWIESSGPCLEGWTRAVVALYERLKISAPVSRSVDRMYASVQCQRLWSEITQKGSCDSASSPRERGTHRSQKSTRLSSW